MKRTLGFLVVLAFALAMAGCSYISSFYSSASSFPSAATLQADCASGLAKTPPVRDNACDLYQAVAQFCMGQSMLPLNAVQACTLAGYPVTAANMQRVGG